MAQLQIALRQLKLTSGEELVCEIMDYGDYDDEENHMAVRNPFKLVAIEHARENVRYYAFRPFMLYQGDGNHVQIVNPHHVVAECTPTREMIEQYTKAVDDHNSNEETQVLKSLDETKKAVNEYYDKIQEMVKSGKGNDLPFDLATDVEVEYDSDLDGNIITFPGSNTKH
jgi:hypothetical protein